MSDNAPASISLDDDSIQRLAAAIAQTRSLPPDKRLWDGDMIADFIGVTRHTALYVYACRSDFPRPMVFSDGNGDGTKPTRRWHPADIKLWAERRRGGKG